MGAAIESIRYHQHRQAPLQVVIENRNAGSLGSRRRLLVHFLSLIFVGLSLFAVPLSVHATVSGTISNSAAASDQFAIDLGAPPQLNPSIQAIKDSGVLRVGIAYPDNLPFYGHDDNGQLIGYDVDIARGMAKALDIEPLFVQPKVTYTRLVQLLSSNQFDIAIGKLSLTIPRLALGEAVPYMNLRQSLLINREVLEKISEDPKTIGSRLRTSTIRIGVIGGSSHAIWGSSSFPNAEFKTYPNWQACADALINRQVDALYRDGFETSRLVKSNPRLALEYVPVILEDRPDNVALYMGQRMQGLQAPAQLFVNITTGVISEEDLFRQFKKEMKQSSIKLAGKVGKLKFKKKSVTTTKGVDQ